jgi:hypothetical protein
MSLNHSCTDEIVIANLISILGKKVIGLYLLIFLRVDVFVAQKNQLHIKYLFCLIRIKD